jgi:hypothetical protein
MDYIAESQDYIFPAPELSTFISDIIVPLSVIYHVITDKAPCSHLEKMAEILIVLPFICRILMLVRREVQMNPLELEVEESQLFFGESYEVSGCQSGGAVEGRGARGLF